MKTLNRVTLKRALAVGISLAGIAAGYQVFAADEAKPAATEQPTSLRISPSQYRQSITDIFGSSIAITGRFEPETRDEGLMAVGARTANVSDSGLERYDDLARGIALQVVDERHRYEDGDHDRLGDQPTGHPIAELSGGRVNQIKSHIRGIGSAHTDLYRQRVAVSGKEE